MSQTTKPTGTQGQTGGPRGKRAPVYGRGPPGGNNDRPRRPRREPVEEIWIPKTNLGKKVASGEITSLEEIIESGLIQMSLLYAVFNVLVNNTIAIINCSYFISLFLHKQCIFTL